MLNIQILLVFYFNFEYIYTFQNTFKLSIKFVFYTFYFNYSFENYMIYILTKIKHFYISLN